MHARAITQGNLQVPGGSRSGGEQQGVVFGEQSLDCNTIGAAAADIGIHHKSHPFFPQQVHPAVDQGLFQLHVGNAVHQQAANAVIALIHR